MQHELKDFCDRAPLYARAEPDDEYDPRPEPVDPYLIDQTNTTLKTMDLWRSTTRTRISPRLAGSL